MATCEHCAPGHIGYKARALLIAATASSVAVTGLALTAGPVVTPARSLLSWTLCALLPLGILLWAIVRMRDLSGFGAARLLKRSAPGLESRLLGALELDGKAQSHHHSGNLAEAHLAAVAQQLRALPPQQVVPLGTVFGTRTRLGGCVLLVTIFLLLAHPGLRTGLAALRFPAQVGQHGVLIAAISDDVQAHLLFPSYLGRPAETLKNPVDIRAPIGTTVRLSVIPKIDVDEVAVRLPGREVPLVPEGDHFQGRFVVRESGPLQLMMRSGSQRYRDQRQRSVTAVADNVPIVEVLRPLDETTVHPESPLRVAFRAQDDKGLQTIQIVVRLLDDTEIRRPLWSAQNAGEQAQTLESHGEFIPLNMGVQPGDRFTLWLEAQDGDAVSGPHLSQSNQVRLQALSSAQYLSAHLPKLREVLDDGLVALADRLEQPLPKSANEGRKRLAKLAEASERFASGLTTLQQSLAQTTVTVRSAGLDGAQLGAMADRVTQKQRQESSLYKRGSSPFTRRSERDLAMVDELEGDLLMLSDLLSQAHLDEANALSAELQELRQRMQHLLAQLSKSESEAAKRDLLAELARAESRLRELQRSMAALAARVPDDFVNHEALSQQGAQSTMQDLRDAIQAGDMEAAAEHLANLEQQLESLSDHLEEGGLSFREARFGPRDKALMEARERLAVLTEEQSRLADRSAEQVRDLLQRTPKGQRVNQDSLRTQGQRIQEQLQALRPDVMGDSERAMLDRAEQRIQDTLDSLQTGDLSEAARMSAAGARTIDRMAHNLDTDAQMFPGHDGQMADNAETAAKAQQATERLAEQLEQALPKLAEHIQADDLRQLQQQAKQQGSLQDSITSLQEQFDKGPDGLPLEPQAGAALEQVTEAMDRAQEQLQQGDPQGANLAQEEAREQLRQLGEQLAENASGSQSSGSGGEGRGKNGDLRGKVEIPSSDDFHAPQEQRRRLLDAMREQASPGYEAAVRRYYQELLR